MTDTDLGEYQTALDMVRLAAEQPAQRAKICDRLETMWKTLQKEIEDQQRNSERGADPRLWQLQLQTLKLQAQLWRMLAAPLPEAPPEQDPDEEARDNRAAAEEALELVAAKAAPGPKQPPDLSWPEGPDTDRSI